ncbi:MAG: hypothetical protein V3S14_11820 [Anaerolineae bacterium]
MKNRMRRLEILCKRCLSWLDDDPEISDASFEPRDQLVDDLREALGLLTNQADGEAMLALDPASDRPLCPRCGERLYAAIEAYASGVIPTWENEGEDAPYYGFSAIYDEGDHRESDMTRLYCQECGWEIDPREVKVGIERGVIE